MLAIVSVIPDVDGVTAMLRVAAVSFTFLLICDATRERNLKFFFKNILD